MFGLDAGLGQPCDFEDPVLTIRDSAGAELAQADDRVDGVDKCPLLNFTIAGGQTVFLHVTEFEDDDEIPGYFLLIDAL
jgi:hypothetical protein